MPPAATSSQALGNIQSFQGSMQSGQDIYKANEQSLGIPQAQQQVSGLRQAITNTTNLLNQVAPSVYGRTQNSLVTSAQAGRQIANEQAPISQELGKESTDLTNADTNYKDLLGQATTLSDLQDKSQQEKLSGLGAIYDRLYAQEKDTSAGKAAQDQFAAQQALEQQKLSEQQREFNNTPRGAAARVPTASEQLQSAVQGMSSQLSSVTGADGYISPDSYAKGKTAWVQAGLDPKKYDTYFSIYRNPKNPYYVVG